MRIWTKIVNFVKDNGKLYCSSCSNKNMVRCFRCNIEIKIGERAFINRLTEAIYCYACSLKEKFDKPMSAEFYVKE